jgi:hypothetical protein
MKASTKDVVVNLLILLVGVYLPFAFIVNEFNPLAWNWMARSLYVLTLVVLVTYAIKEYKQK